MTGFEPVAHWPSLTVMTECVHTTGIEGGPGMLLNFLPGQGSSPQRVIQPNMSMMLKLRSLAGETDKSVGTVKFQCGPLAVMAQVSKSRSIVAVTRNMDL